jgi:hypothetical protein
LKIHNLAGKEVSYEDYTANGQFETDVLQRTLNKTEIVNLKKTWGSDKTPWESLNDYLKSGLARGLLRKQIEYISPDIVICGGMNQVFDFASDIFDGDIHTLHNEDGSETKYFQIGKIIFVNVYRPSYIKERKYFYEFSVKTFRSLYTLL